MGEVSFRAEVSADAWADPTEIAESWSARRAREARVVSPSTAREILVFRVHRLIYEIDDENHTVTLLRFWHAHRDAPESDA